MKKSSKINVSFQSIRLCSISRIKLKTARFVFPDSTLFGIILLFACLNPLFAAIDDTVSENPDSGATKTDTEPLSDTVVVTATRSKRGISKVPSNVTIITREEIDASPARNIDDLLQNKCGVVVRRSVGMGEGIPAEINLRGIPGANRVLILIDGIPTNASGTPFLFLNEVPLESIERVEVIKGPYSSLYGANAFSGVINMITRNPYGLPTVELYNDIGSWLYWSSSAWSGGSLGPIGYTINGGIRSIGNYIGRDFFIRRKGENVDSINNTDNFGFGDTRLFGKMTSFLGERTTVSFQSRYMNSNLGFGYTKKLTEKVVIKGHKLLVSPTITHMATDWLMLKSSGFYRYVVGTFLNEQIRLQDTIMEPSVWEPNVADGQFEIQGIVRYGGFLTLTSGFELYFNRTNFGTIDHRSTREQLTVKSDKRISNAAAYMQAEMDIKEHFTLIPSLRYDDHSLLKGTFSPRFGIVSMPLSLLRYFGPDIPSTALRGHASIGRAFRTPTMGELYMPGVSVNSSTVIKGNSTLSSEYITSYDIGAELQPLKFGLTIPPLKHLQFNATYFNNVIRNAIYYDVPLAVSKINHLSYRNRDSLFTKGLEFELQTAFDDFVSMYGSYVFQQTQDNGYGVPLDFQPSHKAGFGLIVRLPVNYFEFESNFSGLYASDRNYADIQTLKPQVTFQSYNTYDVSLKCTYKNFIGLGMGIQNLLDEYFEETSGTLAPGRMIMIKSMVKLPFWK